MKNVFNYLPLSPDIPRRYELGDVNEFPVKPDIFIVEGAAVSVDNEGYAKPLQTGEAKCFVGFAEQAVDMSTGGHLERTVRVKSAGKIQLEVPDVNHSHLHATVYASGEDSFTLTAEGNTAIGKIYRINEDGTCIVSFQIPA
jgi:hypothetical protein